MKKRFKSLLFLAGALIMMCPASNVFATASTGVAIDETNFPDANFRAYVTDEIDQKDAGGNKDNVLSAEEIADVKIIYLPQGTYQKTESLEGIDIFTNLEELSCAKLNLQSLDVTAFSKLRVLECGGNSIKTLDVSKNPLLEELDCSTDGLNSLVLSANTKLTKLDCSHNTLSTGLDLKNNTLLKELRINNAGISSIELSHLQALEILDCGANGMKTIPVDPSKNPNLKELYCYGMKSLDNILTVSNYPELKILDCHGSSIKSLVASNNQNLELLVCYGSSAQSLSSSFTDVDASKTLLRDYKITQYKSQSSLEALDVSGDAALRVLDCSYNLLTALDVSECGALEFLDCSKNNLTVCEVESNRALSQLYCEKNKLTSIDVKNNSSLLKFNCSENELELLDLSQNTVLNDLNCDQNHLTTLDVTACDENITVSCTKNTYDIELDEDYYEYDMNNLPGHKFMVANANDQDNTEKKALFTGTKPGNAVIIDKRLIPEVGAKTVQYTYYYGQRKNPKKACTFTLNIKEPLQITVRITGTDKDGNPVTEDKESGDAERFLAKDQIVQCEAFHTKTKKPFKNVSWKSENEDYVMIDENGLMTAKQATTSPVTVNVSINGQAKGHFNVGVKQPVTGIQINDPENLQLDLYTNDDAFPLSTTVEPSNATNQVLAYKSSNSNVVSVDANGKVKGVTVGTAYVWCEATDDSGVKSEKIAVTVKQGVSTFAVKNENGVSITSKCLVKGDTYRLTGEVLPKDAEDTTVTWESLNPSVVTVDKDGMLTALEAGEAKIVCYPNLRPTWKIYVTVTVCDEAFDVSLNHTEYTLIRKTVNVTPSVELTAEAVDDKFDEDKLEWYSSDPDVAEVGYKTGKVTAKTSGKATIYCRVGNADVGRCEITVVQWITSISMVDFKQSLVVGEKYTLKAGIEPEYASNKTLTWKSSNDSVVSVDANGTVTAKKAGATATISCTATDGSNKTANVKITVTQPVKSITISPTSGNVLIGKKLAITSTVLPADAVNKKLLWTSSNPAIATVSSSRGGSSGATITGIKKGSAVITATAQDGSGVKATFNVSVLQPVQTISLNTKYKVLKKGKSLTLKTKIAPSSASNKGVIWTTSDKRIATVSSKGKVTAKKAGSVVITCTAKDGSGVSTTCRITVGTPVTKVSLNKTKITIKKGKSFQLTAKIGPTKATDKSVTWTSSKPKVASVNNRGSVYGMKKGTTIITCKANDGSGKKKTCKVTVK